MIFLEFLANWRKEMLLYWFIEVHLSLNTTKFYPDLCALHPVHAVPAGFLLALLPQRVHLQREKEEKIGQEGKLNRG